jgi:hypothetical protein
LSLPEIDLSISSPQTQQIGGRDHLSRLQRSRQRLVFNSPELDISYSPHALEGKPTQIWRRSNLNRTADGEINPSGRLSFQQLPNRLQLSQDLVVT